MAAPSSSFERGANVADLAIASSGASARTVDEDRNFAIASHSPHNDSVGGTDPKRAKFVSVEVAKIGSVERLLPLFAA